MDKLDYLIEQYVERFHDNFPWFLIKPTHEEALELIQKCLATGKPVRHFVDLSIFDDPNVCS